jgi:hypothetical protein
MDTTKYSATPAPIGLASSAGLSNTIWRLPRQTMMPHASVDTKYQFLVEKYHFLMPVGLHSPSVTVDLHSPSVTAQSHKGCRLTH